MALILNFDTATSRGSVSLARCGELLQAFDLDNQQEQAGSLARYLKLILTGRDKGGERPDAVAISGGPGSFTGLRVAAAAAKGLCFSWDIPLIALDTLMIMARNLQGKKLPGDIRLPVLYAPMIDARRREVFTAWFDRDLNLLRKSGPLILNPEAFLPWLEHYHLILGGDGSQKSRDILLGIDNLTFMDCYPDPRSQALLAEEAFQAGQFEDLVYYEPFYGKDFFNPSFPP